MIAEHISVSLCIMCSITTLGKIFCSDLVRMMHCNNVQYLLSCTLCQTAFTCLQQEPSQ